MPVSWFRRTLRQWVDVGQPAQIFGRYDDFDPGVSRSASVEDICDLPEVGAACLAIMRAVQRCPIKVREKRSKSWEDAEHLDLYEILNSLPNSDTTAHEFIGQLVDDLLRKGKAFARILRHPRTGAVLSLRYLDPDKVTRGRNEDGVRTWTIKGKEPQTFVMDSSRPPILDLVYTTPVHHHAEFWALALSVSRQSARYYTSGMRSQGYIEVEDQPTIEEAEAIRNRWRALNGNDNGPVILGAGLKWQKLGDTADDGVIVDTRGWIRELVSGLFGVPASRLGDQTKVSYSSLEQNDLQFVAEAVEPLLTLIEQTFRRDLLSDTEYRRIKIVFDRSALISTDLDSRIKALSAARQNGIYSSNDVREKLNENPLPDGAGGDLYVQQVNVQPVTATPQNGNEE